MQLIGGILLIVGTAIGGGMLALPVATAEIGFSNSLMLMFACWFVMTTSALLVLEINLWLPPNTNIVSMAKIILGPWGTTVAWVSYLLLFYSVLSAYMAGGADFLYDLFNAGNIPLPRWLATLLFTAPLGCIVYQGIRYVDYVNRGLMLSKLGIYILLIICILPFIARNKLTEGHFVYVAKAVTVIITSFTFANIVPSLCTYFKGDVAKLRKIILIGSLIPLLCYVLWDLAIMGVIPRKGDHGLINMLEVNQDSSGFITQLSHRLNNPFVTTFSRIFSPICLATSFLGSALGLSDFLADGLQASKKGKQSIVVYCATFLPSLFVVLFYPHIFITALSYAGVCCVLLLALLPALMTWRGRYGNNPIAHGYRVPGGKFLLSILIITATLIILYAGEEALRSFR